MVEEGGFIRWVAWGGLYSAAASNHVSSRFFFFKCTFKISYISKDNSAHFLSVFFLRCSKHIPSFN